VLRRLLVGAFPRVWIPVALRGCAGILRASLSVLHAFSLFVLPVHLRRASVLALRSRSPSLAVVQSVPQPVARMKQQHPEILAASPLAMVDFHAFPPEVVAISVDLREPHRTSEVIVGVGISTYPCGRRFLVQQTLKKITGTELSKPHYPRITHKVLVPLK
jgi:hypothetical protein